jgi:hypothetical protein
MKMRLCVRLGYRKIMQMLMILPNQKMCIDRRATEAIDPIDPIERERKKKRRRKWVNSK